ncbi:MAG: substrate-binding domain-containing protein [Pyrodictiaceae archaeon]
MPLPRLYTRVLVELVDDEGRTILDEALGKLLLLIDKCGSILCASRSLGIAYSRAWERISRAEKLLGIRIVEAKRGGRGGGGASLTEEGRELLLRFLEAYRRIHGSDPKVSIAGGKGVEETILYAGSNDPALQRLIGLLRERGVAIEAHWIGSLRGVAAILLGEADVAGVHLVDPTTGEYNTHIAGLVAGRAVVIKGYERLQGFLSRQVMSLEETIEGLFAGRLSLVNREESTGTRLLLEYVLKREARRRGLSIEFRRVIRGWDNTARTHMEVAERVARGEADVGLAIEAAARAYGLNFTPLTWERFDYIVRGDSLEKNSVKEFLRALCSSEFKEILSSMPGYRARDDMCSVKEETMIA